MDEEQLESVNRLLEQIDTMEETAKVRDEIIAEQKKLIALMKGNMELLQTRLARLVGDEE